MPDKVTSWLLVLGLCLPILSALAIVSRPASGPYSGPEISVISVTTFSSTNAGAKSDPPTYYVDVNSGADTNNGLSLENAFKTIQHAIAAASTGDTISVRSGTYHESIIINKAISLIGDSKENTIITGPGIGDVMVSFDGARISGFTIKNSGENATETTGDAGIKLNGVTNCVISNNIIENNCFGIFMNSSSNNVLENNLCQSNGDGGGILLYNNSDNNRIINNTSNSNGGFGGILVRDYCDNNTIANNTTRWNNRWDQHGIKLMIFCDNNLVENNTSENNGDGIFLRTSSNNKIINNTCNLNIRPGIQVHIGNYNNIFANNTCNWNTDHGIGLYFSSDNNVIDNNVCSNNDQSGIFLWSSDNNTITNNSSNSNKHGGHGGIELENSSYNELFYNTISMNTQGIIVTEGTLQPAAEEIFHMDEVGITPSENSVGNRINWNNIVNNTNGNTFGALEIDATQNWWGDPTGPYHESKNPSGLGDKVMGNVDFEPWLRAPQGSTPEEVTAEEAKLVNWLLIGGLIAAVIIVLGAAITLHKLR